MERSRPDNWTTNLHHCSLFASMAEPHRPQRPVLYWDRDCEFCRRWVERWQAVTGTRVDYRLLQEASPEVIAAAGGLPPQRIVLAEGDGSLKTGALAALAALAPESAGARGLLRACQAIPMVHCTAESAYRWIAGHRAFCARATNLLWGCDVLPPTYRVAGWIFPRAIGLVFLCAFLSLWAQIDGLAGSQGILPVAQEMEAVRNHCQSEGTPASALLYMPSLLWLGASDAQMQTWLAIGTVASLLLLAGVFPAWSALAAWAVYLSFAAAVPMFLNFQWDALLLEAGLLAVFCVPWCACLSRARSEPPRLGRMLVWWLLFRLMLESGIVKLYGFNAAGRNAWLDGTALDFHYFTQPLPVWTSWWCAQFPAWFQRISLAIVFLIELVLPFFMFGPRRMRMTAFWGFALLMVLIMATGHYGFFNILTLALGVCLVDDASWPGWLGGAFSTDPTKSTFSSATLRMQKKLLPYFAAVIFVVTGILLLVVLRVLPMAWAAPVAGPLLSLRSTNSYGLFSVMTTERPEITIEASADGSHWDPYVFRYKMDAANADLSFIGPHMPRLDWQMWFAALEFRERKHPPAWLIPLIMRLEEGSPGVTSLLNTKAALPKAPRFFRLRLDLLTFSTPAEKAATGQVWQARALPEYTIQGTLPRKLEP